MLKGLVRDSAVVGTYKRLKGVGKPRKNYRNYNAESQLLYDLLLAIVEKNKKGKK